MRTEPAAHGCAGLFARRDLIALYTDGPDRVVW